MSEVAPVVHTAPSTTPLLQRRLVNPGLVFNLLLLSWGMALAWVPVTFMLAANWMGIERWGWNGAATVGLVVLTLPLLLGIRGAYAGWTHRGRPVLIPGLALVMGLVLGHVMVVQWLLVSTQNDTMGTLIDYATVSARVPSYSGKADTWYDHDGKLRPEQKAAWCQTTMPVVDIYRNQAQLHRDSGAGLRAVTANTLIAVQHQFGCIDDETYIAQRADMNDVVQHVRSQPQAIIDALSFLPLYDHLHEVRVDLLTLGALTEKEWCQAHLHRKYAGEALTELSRCAALSSTLEVRNIEGGLAALVRAGVN